MEKACFLQGLLGVSGKFNRGDSVQIVDCNGNEIAVGMVDYSHSELEKVKGLNSRKIEEMLGFKHNDEIIHRDNLLITYGQDGDETCQ